MTTKRKPKSDFTVSTTIITGTTKIIARANNKLTVIARLVPAQTGILRHLHIGQKD